MSTGVVRCVLIFRSFNICRRESQACHLCAEDPAGGLGPAEPREAADVCYVQFLMNEVGARSDQDHQEWQAVARALLRFDRCRSRQREIQPSSGMRSISGD
eukprot:jgi/Picre1/34412/NNA_001881.t1